MNPLSIVTVVAEEVAEKTIEELEARLKQEEELATLVSYL